MVCPDAGISSGVFLFAFVGCYAVKKKMISERYHFGWRFLYVQEEAALWFFVITKNANTRMKNCVQQKMCITQNGCASPFESESAILVLRCKS